MIPLVPFIYPCPPGDKIVRLDFRAELMPSAQQKVSNSQLLKTLGNSSLFRDFRSSFETATRLPLSLRAVESWQLAHAESPRLNGFCSLLSESNQSCAACLQTQQKACETAKDGSFTTRCSFGLVETAVRVKVGQGILGYLQTGQVFFKTPSVLQTKRAVRDIRNLGFTGDDADAARRYNGTPVVHRSEYEATIELLKFFADHLGSLANQIALQHQTAEPLQITRARKFIEDHHRQKLSLAMVARHAGVSMFHFCTMFKKATGVRFTEYVSRVRVESAKSLLLNVNDHVGEIAYQVGFQSLTHFNRAFKGFLGESPTEYRAHLRHQASL